MFFPKEEKPGFDKNMDFGRVLEGLFNIKMPTRPQDAGATPPAMPGAGPAQMGGMPSWWQDWMAKRGGGMGQMPQMQALQMLQGRGPVRGLLG
jgi:hypothetical protein